MQQGFVAERDVDVVHRSIKGIGTNEGNLVNTLCNRTKKQIDAVDLLYHETARGLTWESIFGFACCFVPFFKLGVSSIGFRGGGGLLSLGAGSTPP